MRITSYVVFGLFVCATLIAAIPSATADDGKLRVVTYNVQFLPGIAASANKRKEPEYRAKRIGEEMAKFDVVALNEVFDARWRDLILEELKKAWGGDINVLISPKPEKQFNGGCLIASRLPFLETNSYIYTHFSDPKDYGVRADGFAAKGVIHARIKRSHNGSDDDFVDVFATHMEARDDDLRELQYPELAAFIKAKSSPDRPMLLLGDLNTRGHPPYLTDPESQYARLMAQLRSARSEIVDVWPMLHPDKLGGTSEQESADVGKRIDYILVANPESGKLRLEPETIAVNLYQDDRVEALSDHNAVEGVFQWISPRSD